MVEDSPLLRDGGNLEVDVDNDDGKHGDSCLISAPNMPRLAVDDGGLSNKRAKVSPRIMLRGDKGRERKAYVTSNEDEDEDHCTLKHRGGEPASNGPEVKIHIPLALFIQSRVL
jgi:hypothetical protein